MRTEAPDPNDFSETIEAESKPIDLLRARKLANEFYLKAFTLKEGEMEELIVDDEAVLVARVHDGYREVYDFMTGQLLAAKIVSGFVEFNLKSDNHHDKSPYIWASDFFNAAVKYHQSQTEVLGVAAFWPQKDSVNNKVFWENLRNVFEKKKSVDEHDVEVAIWSTWTAKQATKAEFSRIHLYSPDLEAINKLLNKNEKTFTHVKFVREDSEER